MKKGLIAAVCFVFFVFAANAQFFAGAGFGIGFGGGNNKSEFNFNLGPEVGYIVDEKLDVGVGLNLGLEHKKEAGVKTNTTSWEIEPFARYSLYEYHGVELLGRAGVCLGGANSSVHFGINLVPMVVYNLNEKIELQAIIDFLTLDFKVQDSHASFGLNLETRANAQTSSPIRFGFAYKF